MITRENMEGSVSKKKINDIKGFTFTIPEYQRGYRWQIDNVEKLIKDIMENSTNEYCLMPVIVRRTEEENKYEIVDGQQRLTTLNIILGGSFYTIGDENSYSKLDSFLIDKISEYVKSNDNVEEIKNKIKNTAFVIWYELSNCTDKEAIDTFNRINSWKIPLKEAELIKAYILSSYSDKIERREATQKWKELEILFNKPSFFSFFTIGNKNNSKYESCHEELLVELYYKAEKEQKESLSSYPIFEYIQNNNITGEILLSELMHLAKRMEDLFLDRTSYHLASFLLLRVNNKRDAVDVLKTYIKEGKKGLLEDVKTSTYPNVKLENCQKEKLEEFEYGSTNKEIRDTLTLYNLFYVQNSLDKFLRYPTVLHSMQSWSLEHIHAKNEHPLTEKDIEDLNEKIRLLKRIRPEAKVEVVSKDTTTQKINDYYNDVVYPLLSGAKQDEDGKIDKEFDYSWYEYSIKNLALLPSRVNSKLNNSTYAEKVDKIEALDFSSFIPPCTLNVFKKEKDRYLWTKEDGEKYLEKIICTINKGLKECEK